jgi:hypothetical protein
MSAEHSHESDPEKSHSKHPPRIYPVAEGVEQIVAADFNGGLQVDQARRLKELEPENAKFKRLVSELSLEKLVLKDIAAEPSCQH